MAWRMPTWSRALGSAGLEVLLVLGEQRSPVDGGDGLDRHPEDDEDDQAHHQQGGADHQHRDHPVGGHLALDDLGGAEPGEAEEAAGTSRRRTRRPPTAGSAGRRPPTPGRRTRRRRPPAGATSVSPTSLGRMGLGSRLGAGRHVGRGTSAGDRWPIRSAAAAVAAFRSTPTVVGTRTPGGRRLHVVAGAHRSTPAPLRDRLTMAEAIRLITRVITKRTNPHQQQVLESRGARPSRIGWR